MVDSFNFGRVNIYPFQQWTWHTPKTCLPAIRGVPCEVLVGCLEMTEMFRLPGKLGCTLSEPYSASNTPRHSN